MQSQVKLTCYCMNTACLLVAQYMDNKVTRFKYFNGDKGSTVVCHTMKHYHTEGVRQAISYGWLCVVICGLYGTMGGYIMGDEYVIRNTGNIQTCVSSAQTWSIIMRCRT